MIACLSLVNHSHVRTARTGSQSVTACGLAIDEAHVTPALFVAAAADATCPQCRFAQPPGEPMTTQPLVSTGEFARRFLECVVGTHQVDALDRLLTPGIASWFIAARIERLHELFPDLGIAVDEVLADGEKALVRYTLSCTDRSGLIGPAGRQLSLRQAVVLEVSGGLLARIEPLVDAFALWIPSSPGDGAA
jgi:predicted ester cyclase